MHEIDLRKIDLNLLVVFEALMQERSVTKVAQQLSRTQSAISHALERLRQQLGDPLLVRQGGEMVPSPFAEHLMGQVHPLLRQMAQALTAPEVFDPATSTRTFRIAMRDFLAGLFPDLVHLVQTQAPLVKLEWVQAQNDAFASLTDGSLDALLGPTPMPTPAGIERVPVGGLGWACFMHEHHPARAGWGPAAWAQWPHVQVGVSDPVRNPVTQAASAVGLERNVAVSVPLFSAVPAVLANSNLLATLPQAVMRDQLQFWRLVELPAPFAIDPIEHALYSARRLTGDTGQVWFKERVHEALRPFLA